MKISQFSTLTFDCYGTLIDWEFGIYNAMIPLIEKADATISQDDSLYQFAQTESRIQSENPSLGYAGVLAKVHAALAQQFGVQATDENHQAFAAAIKDWPAFSDSAQSLQYLKKHFKLVIISNVDREGFNLSNSHLKVEFDAVYTAEDVGSYKPSSNNFNYMLSKLKDLSISKSDILHTAQSLYHDMVPAVEQGLATCWIDRRSGQSGSGATPVVDNPPQVDMRFESLAEMVRAHQLEIQ